MAIDSIRLVQTTLSGERETEKKTEKNPHEEDKINSMFIILCWDIV